MSQPDGRGGIALDRDERLLASAALGALAAAVRSGRLDESDLVQLVIDELGLSKGFDYPAGLAYHEGMSNAQFSAIERGREAERRERGPQMLVELAADLGVRLELECAERSQKW